MRGSRPARRRTAVLGRDRRRMRTAGIVRGRRGAGFSGARRAAAPLPAREHGAGDRKVRRLHSAFGVYGGQRSIRVSVHGVGGTRVGGAVRACRAQVPSTARMRQGACGASSTAKRRRQSARATAARVFRLALRPRRRGCRAPSIAAMRTARIAGERSGVVDCAAQTCVEGMAGRAVAVAA